MKIIDVLSVAGNTGFFFDDQLAIRNCTEHDGFMYVGEPVIPGFKAIRQAGEAISVMLILEDGRMAYGDCCAVQYSGAGGRDPLFLAKDYLPVIEKYIKPALVGKEADNFRSLCGEIDSIRINGKPLHTAVTYGVSQAILDAVAQNTGLLMCEVVAKEYGTEVSKTRLPIFAQSGDDREINVEKMILKGVDAMPHGLINNVEEKLGKNGEILIAFAKWICSRIEKLKPYDGYQPTFHFDTYGTLGLAFGNENFKRIADYLEELSAAVYPIKLRVECPMDMGSREKEIWGLAELRKEIDARGINAEIVADEWCNTLEDIRLFADAKAGHVIQIKTPDLGGINNAIEAVLYCKEKGMGAYMGGTCNETDRSAVVCTHAAMAVSPYQVLAKPGMGVDEGYMIVYNEMQRIIAYMNAKENRFK